MGIYAACNMPNVLHHTVMITVNVVYYFFVFVYKICCFRLHLLFVRNAEGENIRYGNICTQIIVVFFLQLTQLILKFIVFPFNIFKCEISQIQEKLKQIYIVFVSSSSLNVHQSSFLQIFIFFNPSMKCKSHFSGVKLTVCDNLLALTQCPRPVSVCETGVNQTVKDPWYK